MTSGPQDYFSLLGVDRNASVQDVDKAFKRLSKQFHPDMGGDEARFKELGDARDTLNDPDKRRAYEAGLDRRKEDEEKAEKVNARAPGKKAGSAFSDDLKAQAQAGAGGRSAKQHGQPRRPGSGASVPPPRASSSSTASAGRASAANTYRSGAQTGLRRRSPSSRVQRGPWERLTDGESLAWRLLALLAAAAFLACPLLIMHASIQVSGKASGHGGLNVMDGLLLIIGPVCFVWVLAGVAAVGAAGWMLLVVSVESLVRGISRLPARGITITVISGGVAFLLLNVVSVPLSGNESTRKAPAGTELAHLEEVVKQEKDADESVDNKLDMEEAAVELEPGQWFKPCRFGTPVAADPSGKVYTCDTNGVSSTLEYFAEPNEVQGALLGRAWEVGAVRPKATCPDHAPALQEYELGYLLCFVKHRHLYYAWTNSTEYEVRYTEARFLSANPRAAQQWWKQASKVVSAHWVGS